MSAAQLGCVRQSTNKHGPLFRLTAVRARQVLRVRAACQWLVAGGAPLWHIQARLGHESITTTIDA
jgi:integrase